MRLGRLEITFGKKSTLSPVPDGDRGWWPIIREAAAGNWQKNIEVEYDSVLSNHADFACRTLIASDIAKLRVKLVEKDGSGIWREAERNSPFWPVLRKPNRYQTRIQFFESWMLSKLQKGNAYILKERDNRGGERAGVVKAMYVLDPNLVKPLVSESGAVFYDLGVDHLSGLTQRVVVPSSEIIHDRFNCFFHPMVGLSPIFAGGVPAMQGLTIQKDSTLFFQNGARPGGIIVAPGAISDENAARLKEYWDSNFAGANAGKVAVLGDGLKYEAMRANAVDSQLIEQLKWSAEVICGVYHVPAFMAGVGAEPNYNNVQNLTLRYYSQCLQKHIEDIEACLDEGLGMDGVTIGTEFDTEELLRMDSAAQVEMLTKSISGTLLSPDEARRKFGLPPTPGGASPMAQHQMYSLEALAKRDAREDPFGLGSAASKLDDESEVPKAVRSTVFKTKLLAKLVAISSNSRLPAKQLTLEQH